METGLLASLFTGALSATGIIGAVVIITLFIIIGLMAAYGSIAFVPQMLKGKWEQLFWTGFLGVVAAFYLSFAAYFDTSALAFETELLVVGIFLLIMVGGAFFYGLIAFGYLLHAIWDVAHSLSGVAFDDLALSAIPIGYGMFCLTYDFAIAYYILKSGHRWAKPGQFVPFFWRQSKQKTA